VSDFEMRRIAQRYSSEKEYQQDIDNALGVYHYPFCPIGTCPNCDKERIRRDMSAANEPAGTTTSNET
jgi:hypothetical protein